MTDAVDSDDQGGTDRSNQRVASSTIEQILTGLILGEESGVVRCCACSNVIGATDMIVGYAARCVDAAEWDIHRVYCRDCAPATIRAPTLGVMEAIVVGRVGTRSCPTKQLYRSCLVEVALRACSPPSQG